MQSYNQQEQKLKTTKPPPKTVSESTAAKPNGDQKPPPTIGGQKPTVKDQEENAAVKKASGAAGTSTSSKTKVHSASAKQQQGMAAAATSSSKTAVPGTSSAKVSAKAAAAGADKASKTKAANCEEEEKRSAEKRLRPEPVADEKQQTGKNSSSGSRAAAAGSKQQQQPAVLCLFCQAKLELHPSLVTSGGQIAPIPLEQSSSSSTAALTAITDSAEMVAMTTTGAAVEAADVSQELAERLEAIDPCGSGAGCADASPSSCPLLMAQSGGNWNLLELIGKSTSPLDVPMCKKCATSVAGELQNQLADLEQECVQYKQSLDELLKRRTGEGAFNQQAANRQLETLRTEERELTEQLALLEEEESSLNRELEAKMEEKRQISERDEQLYRKLRDNHRTLIEQADEQRALKLQIAHAEAQTKRLCRANVMDMCFHIWVDGEFGTISGFRIGRLPHEKVEWNEINAGLGQMVFLLKVIAERLDMEFVGYQLLPCGNCSFIRVQRKLSTTTTQQSSVQTTATSSSRNAGTNGSGGDNNKLEEFPLYGTGGWRPFGQPALDKGLVAFMDCFLQVEQKLRQYFPPGSQLLPYRMLKDKVVDKDSQYLVRMQLNSEERWTKAMKCLLLNLKRVIGILTTLPGLAQQQQQQSPSPRPTAGGTGTRGATPNSASNSPKTVGGGGGSGSQQQAP